ncbi:Aste57867_7207 [Aphanomyces stellatus]|uniref:Aste57867_7207 protein n=1 Tax=Aphanomyces stellatus TaxID=120398 RepID=A0A485KG82_9STRA|nr:hypothetical protein As57867_007182 [Aphanomyces stellatus]VFT84133.1 Aste57867_7207 [Aphanomyces stellatus]
MYSFHNFLCSVTTSVNSSSVYDSNGVLVGDGSSPSQPRTDSNNANTNNDASGSKPNNNSAGDNTNNIRTGASSGSADVGTISGVAIGGAGVVALAVIAVVRQRRAKAIRLEEERKGEVRSELAMLSRRSNIMML